MFPQFLYPQLLPPPCFNLVPSHGWIVQSAHIDTWSLPVHFPSWFSMKSKRYLYFHVKSFKDFPLPFSWQKAKNNKRVILFQCVTSVIKK